MSYVQDNSNPYASFGLAADAPADVRGAFIARTYAHLFVAVCAWVVLEVLYFAVLPVGQISNAMMTALGHWTWAVVLGSYMAVSFVANRMAMSEVSKSTQYAGLCLYVVAQSVIFIPLLYMASYFEGALPIAAIATLAIFGSLTAVVFITRKNFSFLAPVLTIGGMAALVVIVGSMIFGFNLGIFFTGSLILLMAGFILYDTSNVLHNYRTDQEVSAALALFASLATLFWYVLQFVMQLQSSD